jgi:hypothetical protein
MVSSLFTEVLPDKILKGDDHQRIILAKLESMIGPVV